MHLTHWVLYECNYIQSCNILQCLIPTKSFYIPTSCTSWNHDVNPYLSPVPPIHCLSLCFTTYNNNKPAILAYSYIPQTKDSTSNLTSQHRFYLILYPHLSLFPTCATSIRWDTCMQTVNFTWSILALGLIIIIITVNSD